jgi:hypothetical protein
VTRVPLVPSPNPARQRPNPTAVASAHAASAAPSAPPARETALPGWIGTVVAVILGAVALAVLLAIVWFLIKDTVSVRKGRLDTEQPGERLDNRREDVLAAVDAGLLDLAADDADPRRAVIACWVRLEQAAAAAGTPRHPGDAPGELVTRLLHEQRVSASALADLAEVYRLARYAATHTVDAGMRAEAQAALTQLRAELAEPAEAPA